MPLKESRLIILAVDDDINDVYFLSRAAEKCGNIAVINGVHDGEEAMRYLSGERGYSAPKGFVMPKVIMTDLKMPKMNGLELLKWVRGHETLSVIPVIVFSSSYLEKDVVNAYKLGANSFITKPRTLSEMVEILRAIYQYWAWCEHAPVRGIEGAG